MNQLFWHKSIKNTIAQFNKRILTFLKQKLMDSALQNWSLKFLEEIQTLIV